MPNVERIGEDLFDVETGEYAGPADNSLPKGPLETEEDLLAFMNRINRAESDLVAERVRLKAVIDNCERMVELKRKRVEWLTAMYQNSAAQIAESLLPRKADGSYRSKTYTCPWGQVAFRDVKSKVVVDNQQLAVAWAKLNAPDAVKVVESVLVSKLPDDKVAEWIDSQDHNAPWGFNIEPGRQSVTLKTVSSNE
jgi:ADP-ribose pyrophosphatase YjhB (NUDIX family)